MGWIQLIHFLTMQGDTYMNEEFQTTSAAEGLPRTPHRESERQFNGSENKASRIVGVTLSPL